MNESIGLQKIESKEPIYSYHVFLFPFKWEIEGKENKLFEEQVDLADFVQQLEHVDSYWEKAAGDWYRTKPRTLAHYNEINYFHDFVHPAMYDDGTDKSFLRHYQMKCGPDARYVIELKNGPVYRLGVDSVLLHVYNTGVGVLSFHLYNDDQYASSPNDILNINQYGRRLYPPFFGIERECFGRPSYFENKNWERGLELTKSLELAALIRLEGHVAIEEDFSEFCEDPRIGKLPYLVEQLFPHRFFEKVRIKPVSDDRMFVVCWYGNKSLSNAISEKKDGKYAYLHNEWWYKYLFMDTGTKTCQNAEMTEELLKAHTNARWVGYGTLYGASRYSFVALTDTVSSDAGFLLGHVQSMYYKMAELCVVQRACILRFSDEVTEVSRLDRRSGLAKRVGSLYKKYIQFVNKIYFREVTAQEQGIELYDLIQRHMRLERDVKDLDGEIQELHQYARLMEEEQQNEALQNLTYLGAFFLVPTFVVGYLGMNVFPSELKEVSPNAHLWVLAASAPLVVLVWWAIKAKRTGVRILLGVMFLIILALIMKNLVDSLIF